MKLLKPGDPCPCCGQPLKEGLPAQTMVLLTWMEMVKEDCEKERVNENAE